MPQMRWPAALLLVGLTAACGSSSFQASPGPSVVVLGHSIGPVRYGEPQPRITKTLGRGISGWRLDAGGSSFHAYPLAGIYVEYSGYPAKAEIIVTRDPEYKSHGVGVGSSLRQLQRQVPVVCFNGTRSAPTTCKHGSPNTKLPATVFRINPTTKRVTQVAIAPGGATARGNRPIR